MLLVYEFTKDRFYYCMFSKWQCIKIFKFENLSLNLQKNFKTTYFHFQRVSLLSLFSTKDNKAIDKKLKI